MKSYTFHVIGAKGHFVVIKVINHNAIANLGFCLHHKHWLIVRPRYENHTLLMGWHGLFFLAFVIGRFDFFVQSYLDGAYDTLDYEWKSESNPHHHRKF